MDHIKLEAKNIAKKNQFSIMMVLLYVGLYLSLRDLVAQVTGVFGIIILLLGLAIEHGKVTVGLKTIHDDNYIPQKEATIGIVKFKTLFTTYLWINLITLVLFIIGFIIVFFCAKPYFLSMLSAIEAELDYGIQLSLNQLAGGVLFISSACLILSELIFNMFFFSAPYLAETKKVYGFSSMVEAFKLGKGKRLQILKLFSHYFVYMICFMCLEFLLNYYLSSSVLASILDIGLTLVAIYVYEGEFVIAKALLFESLNKEGESHDFINA